MCMPGMRRGDDRDRYHAVRQERDILMVSTARFRDFTTVDANSFVYRQRYSSSLHRRLPVLLHVTDSQCESI